MLDRTIYLDYSATTPPDPAVIDYLAKLAHDFYGNANSSHSVGQKSNDRLQRDIQKICDYLGIQPDEIIFTSGASESNNTVLKGVKKEGKKEIITTKLEHSSIYGPLNFLQDQGYTIKFAELTKDGTVDLKKLADMITDQTLLVTIGAVSSELGIRQPIEKIGKLAHDKGVLFHTDLTQALGKIKVNLEDVDYASFSGHKLYGFKGIGALVKKKDAPLENLIHGGKSTSIHRSGTPQSELIGALSKSFELFKGPGTLDKHEKYVQSLNQKIRKHLEKYSDKIKINSPDNAAPYVLNISFLPKKAVSIQKFFDDHGIMISTQTACSTGGDYSTAVFEVTGDKARASSSVRISLSHKTPGAEIDTFLNILDTLMEKYDKID